MAINYIKGEILSENLARTRNLSFDTDLLVLDVINGRIGVKTAAPTEALDVAGNIKSSADITALTATITNSATIGNVSIGTNTISTSGPELELTSSSNLVTLLGNMRFDATATSFLTGTGPTAALTFEVAADTTLAYDTSSILPAPATSFTATATGAPYGFYMTPDGFTIFYVDDEVALVTTKIYQATLGTAYDISTAGAITSNVVGTTLAGAAHGITFDPTDGLSMYISQFSGVNTIVEKFTLGTAYTPSTAGAASGTTGTFGNSDTNNYAPVYSVDGLKVYLGSINASLQYIDEYSLSVAYDLTSTIAWLGRHDISTEIVNSFNYITVNVAVDGFRVFAGQYDNSTDQFATYDLASTFDITTASLRELIDTTLGGAARAMWFSEGGEPGFNLYWMISAGNTYQYDTSVLVTGAVSSALNYDGAKVISTVATGAEVFGNLGFSGADSLLIPPIYTTATLPATPTEGGTVYDSTSKQIKFYDGTQWSDVASTEGLSVYVIKAATTDATLTEALVGGAGGTQLILPDSTTWRFEANIVARQTSATIITTTNFVTGTRYVITTTGDTNFTLIGAADSNPGTAFIATGPGAGTTGQASVGEVGDSSGYKFTGVINRQVGVATTDIVGFVAEVIDAEDNALWAVTVDADATTGALRVQVTGEATDISWVAFIRTVEVTG